MDSPNPEREAAARSVVSAAERGDRLAFASATERYGSLDEAQELVRSKGIVRMIDRVVATVDVVAQTLTDDSAIRDASGEAETPTLFGHFAVFNEWTEIDSMFEGHFLERIAPGAFKKTMREKADKVRLLFQHGHDPELGDKPIGSVEAMHEDTTGAYYEASLFDGLPPLLDAGLRAGAYGASFRFAVHREEFVGEPDPADHNPKGLPERTLKEVELFEFGPVTFPAYESATAGVRSANGNGAEEDVAVAPSDADAAQTRTSENERRDHSQPLYGLRREEERPSWHL